MSPVRTATPIQAGHRERAITPEGDLTEVVYEYRPYRLEDTGSQVKDLLVGVESGTGRILAIPPQSLLRLQHERRLKEKSLQGRLPLGCRDMLLVMAQVLDAPHPDKFAHAIVRFYLAEAQRDPAMSQRLVHLARSKPLRGEKTAPFKVLVEPRVSEWVDHTVAASDTVTRTDLIRSAILAAQEDIFGAPRKRRRDQLAAIALAV